jgi:hypothetical protein
MMWVLINFRTLVIIWWFLPIDYYFWFQINNNNQKYKQSIDFIFFLKNKKIIVICKHSTQTLSFVIHGVHSNKKNLQKRYISISGEGVKLRTQSIFVVNWVSSCLSLFLSASTSATDIFTTPSSTTTIISSNLVH